ncbi:isoaspartyl peptidase/L-asparaginase [Aspergillus mulundensis]|uniref:Asparaginase n=1 Tax=Aspergillus mulundensis TaxID=1810919 RepID=A0A3D8S4Q4_9EURO|nr:Asparaginase [Aspergillus mulundensis]RDW81180.1 Asparaginase [Aspergillus mulundensis]
MMTPNPIFKPTLILHGGAGAIHRSTLPPDLWAKYQASLLAYLRSTKHLLDNGARALDAAVHAVSLMEDDELFNCGRGSVFTSAGTIEMEASVMVTSVRGEDTVSDNSDTMKRGAGVIGIRNVRHPIQLAREVLARSGQDENGGPVGGDEGRGGSMHSQLAGPYVEGLAREWGLEFKPDEWFWTQKRWEEHLRGLEKSTKTQGELMSEPVTGYGYPSQGTVGCVCLDQWGDLAVATSTGGLTNKLPGRVGDTPTLGAGFWAETWAVEGSDAGPSSLSTRRHEGMQYLSQTGQGPYPRTFIGPKSIWQMTLADCWPALPHFLKESLASESDADLDTTHALLKKSFIDEKPKTLRSRKIRRAVAVSGTGNGDSFLRTAAARTACAMVRFSEKRVSLADAVTAVAGADGELQRSAGRRWGKTGEGQGGIIGIEAEIDDGAAAGSSLGRGKVIYDFNCGGMFRAWAEEGVDGDDVEHVMVFREPYM